MEDILAELFESNEETHSQDGEQATLAPDEVLDDLDLDDDDDFDSPVDQDPKPTDTDEQKDDKKEKPEDSDQSKIWEDEKANLEKRVNDNRASYQRANQAKLDAEKENADLKAKLEAKRKEDNYDDWLDGDNSNENKSNAEIETLQQQVNDLNKRDVERTQVVAAEQWERASKPIREKHEDFDKYVDAVADAYDGNTELQAEFEEMGRTPEAAYKLGKKLEQQEMMKDPDKYKAYLLDEFKKEQTEKSKNISTKNDELDDLDGNSTPPDDSNVDDVDVLTSLFG